ncbi:MAG TPA: GNAT family N-acetyltransferase [Verrucomicrobiae bacterium]
MKPTIRVMTMDDFDAVLALWQSTEGVGLNEMDSRENISRFLVRNDGLSFVVLDESGNIIGAMLGGTDGRRGYLHHLAVAKDYRGQGLGRQLVETCLKALKAQGIKRCSIFVYANNVAGQSFWKHLGWSACPELLIMRKQTGA